MTSTIMFLFLRQYKMLVRMWCNYNYHTLLTHKQTGRATLETLAVSDSVTHTLTHKTDNTLLLGIYTRQMKTNVNTKTCTQVAIAALLIIPQRGQNLHAHQLVMHNKLWYMHAKEHYSGMRRMIYTKTHMNLKSIMLSGSRKKKV